MKQRKYLIALCGALFLLLLSACGASGESDNSPVIPDALEAVKAASAGEITSITYTRYTEGGALSGSVTDAGTIAEIYQRLCGIELGKESNIGTADDGLQLTLHLSSNTLPFYFEGNNLVIGKKQYVAENLVPLKSYIQQLLSSGPEETPKTEAPAVETAAPEPAALNDAYRYWAYYNGYAYCEGSGQLKYWIEFRDEFYLHCLLRSGGPEYY